MLERLRHHFGGRGALPVNDLRVPTDADNTSGHGVVDCLWHLSTRAGGLGCELAHRPPLTCSAVCRAVIHRPVARRCASPHTRRALDKEGWGGEGAE